MKKILIATATLCLAGSVNAATDAEIYHGFEQGNPDLSTGVEYYGMQTAVQPGIGESFERRSWVVATDNDIYHGFEIWNPDLSTSPERTGSLLAAQPGVGESRGPSERSIATDNDIYHGFEIGNPDL